MHDIMMLPFDFQATEVTFVAKSPAGKAYMEKCFGKGAIAATLQKSYGEAFILALTSQNLHTC